MSYETYISKDKSKEGGNIRVSFSSSTEGYVCGRKWQFIGSDVEIQSNRTGKWISERLNETVYHKAVKEALINTSPNKLETICQRQAKSFN